MRNIERAANLTKMTKTWRDPGSVGASPFVSMCPQSCSGGRVMMIVNMMVKMIVMTIVVVIVMMIAMLSAGWSIMETTLHML